MFDYLVAHGRMKEKEARAKFRQVQYCSVLNTTLSHPLALTQAALPVHMEMASCELQLVDASVIGG